MVQNHTGVRDLLNAIQLGFRARHNTTLQYMRLAEHATLNFNNKMSMAAVFLDRGNLLYNMVPLLVIQFTQIKIFNEFSQAY
jgi:hypothetical protein